MFKRIALIGAMLLALSTPSFAGDISVEGVWARASAGMARAGAAFMTIKNTGEADKLIGAKADVSKRVEIHTHLHQDGVMKMRKVESVAAAKGMTMLKPGGDHVMFMGLNEPFKEGASFPLTLVFEKAGEIKVDVKIMKAGAMGMGEMKHDMKHDMKKMEHKH
ncbi:copper chaperone PCu(A)C [Terasakiella sp. A23]|uniref:copper chaperone PCu(A)C n=1 Tax=Terasakiella sp. FCG-A23 TaxID=3080561 RepID=UPI00295424D9|nr:copper chaperone PCu(A)C [Terasakiella sp. A23]MDV7341681.1 copper chaperone PCu(A)C [Terasakiella sp. A23]